ncbi:hypothetical protein DL96DRAFT_1471924 [Flagelloscypha sp. PMI_526]|nr:hypothetical protein DL96DRAFT_1471924 [Flagelloscypha sp. PMI_526]
MDSFVSFILTNLPERVRASSLCEIFYERYAIYCIPIQREELIQDYLSPMYKYLEDSRINQRLPIPSTTFRPHRCAVPFFVFALAAWLDLSQEQYWIEADRYFHVGLSCLSMQSIFYSPEVVSVQALFLLASYKEIRGTDSASSPNPSWTIISLACKIAQGLGLHRDNSQWNLDDITVQRRRWLYWELISMEVVYGLWSGRPISCGQSYVDTKLPSDLGLSDAHDQSLHGCKYQSRSLNFFRWKHEAARDCFIGLVEELAAATPATYDAILELDRKVRAKEIPPHLNRILIDTGNGSSHASSVTIREFMQSWLLGMARSMVLLAIHQSHLSKALRDPSGSPLKSPYAPSFVASYRAASWIVKSIHVAQRRFPILLPRLGHSWTNGLFCSILMILGSIAINAPSCCVGNIPLEELRIASSMFDEAAVLTVSPRTKNGAKIVQKILARAEEALAQHLAGDIGVAQAAFCIPSTNYGDDELAILGGRTRHLRPSSHQKSPQPQQSSLSHHSDPAGSSPESLDDFHSSLIDFLATAPVTKVASSMTYQEMEGNAVRPLPAPPFRDTGFVPPQPHGWEYDPPPAPQNQYYFESDSGPCTSEVQISDRFENYLNPPVPPVDAGSEPNAFTPWQDFMRQHSLTD